MAGRLDYARLIREDVQHLAAFEDSLEKSGLPLNLLELVKLRASILNGCAFCVRLHMRRLRQQGEAEERIDLVSAWREAPCYTERERASLEYAEEITLLARTQEISDSLYAKMMGHFSERELASLTLAVGLINVWNRLAIAFRADLGSIDALLTRTRPADERFRAEASASR